MHWTQTPEGRRKIRARMKAYAKTPEGLRALRKRATAAREIHSKQAAERRNGHEPLTRATSGRAMLVALARPEAERKIVALQREIETLTLFLEKTKP